MINTMVQFSVGTFQFDENGIADVQPDEFVQHLLSVNPNYRVVEVKSEGEGTQVKQLVSDSVTVSQEGENTSLGFEGTEEELEDLIEKTGVTEVSEEMLHEELDAVAKSLMSEDRLTVEEYKKAKTKKEKVAIINSK